jgi:hypothetical protein
VRHTCPQTRSSPSSTSDTSTPNNPKTKYQLILS